MNSSSADEAELVGAVARSLGVSVRTLHHWDTLGLASPSGRTSGKYRVYLPADVARLRRVLLFRELGIPLGEIPVLLNAGAVERREELERRRAELIEKICHLRKLAEDVDKILAADSSGVLLAEAEQLDVFGAGWDPSWSVAARRRWGDSAQWAEYAERSSKRKADDWRGIVESEQEITATLAQAMRDGTSPGSDVANALAERHRTAMSEYFHCTHSMHVLVARRYVTEPGFIESYDRAESGLAAWTKQIIDANALAKGIDPETAVWE
ncbi:MerR family transcriptional regulator [Saxibacter everestensis]|uniref:MerR family transcriptional regulator n=1 Tax=Saxibacter everestensis TaxID=2909229 RepID=A0ABY8QTN1_9MICO|nr:MerR family transcriptional regulator [Brevibacteriaceae bacterium ZFBP1038]